MLDTVGKTFWDFIVVGSGPSGGRIAFDLTKSGAKVLLLEAGPHFTKKDFPKPEGEPPAAIIAASPPELPPGVCFILYGFLDGP